jgi:hypothetical protein
MAPQVTKDERGINRLNPGERPAPRVRWVGGWCWTPSEGA